MENFLTKEIPKNIRKGEESHKFKKLVEIVKKEKINNALELKKYLDKKIDYHRKWLAEHKAAPTINRLRRKHTHKLEFFRKIREEWLK